MTRPSVLLPATDQQTSSYLSASSVASTSTVPYSTEPTLHCSQCKRDRPVSAFPIRLINLQPYLVCLTHEWYWTEAKRAAQWAPERTMTLAEVCEAFAEIARNEGEFEDRFMIDGDEVDLQRVVDSLANAGSWTIKKLTPRASRAKGKSNEPPPPPTFLYAFREASNPKVNKYKLTIYVHRDERKFTMTLKPEGKQDKQDRGSRPWARPERNKGKAIKRVEAEKGQADRVVPPPPPLPVPLEDRSTGASGGALQQRFDLVQQPSSHASSSLSRAERDAQQMPPPPIPPRKKARRVEPSLVSPSPSRPYSASTTSGFPSYPNSSNLPDPFSQFQNSWPLDGPAPTLPIPPPYTHPSSSSSTTMNLRPTESNSSNRFLSSDALTLFEMLANPAFDPPIIPLLPRPPRNIRRDITPQTQTTPAAAGRELDDAVADALGGRGNARELDQRRVVTAGENELGDGRYGALTDRAGEEEGDYEDSIPDDSSQEEDDEDEEGGRSDREGKGREGEEDEDDVSSFFESSAEEYSDSQEEGEEEDDDEEEEDWLAGFVSKQMPGMVGSGDDGEDDEEDSDRDEADHEMEEQSRQPTQKPRPPSKIPGRGKTPSHAGEDDEVDELESSDGE